MSVPSLEELQLLHNNICQAVGDPKRIQIMYALHTQACNVTGLAELLDMPQPTVSRHLALLKQRGLVKNERDGASVIYRLSDDRIIEVLETMRHILRDVLAQQTSQLEF